jgi:cytochrome c-type protein NapB
VRGAGAEEGEIVSDRSAINVVLVAVVAVAAVGLVSGIESTTRDTRARPEPATYFDPRPADSRSYRDMRERDYGANAELGGMWFETIRTAEKADEAAGRARRAWVGAPPTIPHPAHQHEAPACLACHRHGAKVAGKVATPTTHPERASCLQCHVVAADPRGKGVP